MTGKSGKAFVDVQKAVVGNADEADRIGAGLESGPEPVFALLQGAGRFF